MTSSGLRDVDQRLPPAAEDSYIECGEACLRYRDEGQGPAVVFVHGWTLDLDMWEFQAAELALDYRVVRFDRRGFGFSSGLPSLAQDALDLAALCRHLKIGQIALVGMSQGARIALEVANSTLVPVSCLILDGPPQLASAEASRHAVDLPYQHYTRVARRDGMAEFRREWMLHPLARLSTKNPRAHEILAHMIERYPGHDLLGLATSTREVIGVAELHSRLPPLLFISGECDLESRRRFAKHAASELPQAEHVDIAGAGLDENPIRPINGRGSLRHAGEEHGSIE